MEGIVTMPKIKICGITSVAEAIYLNEAQADYAGLVFYEKSKRNVDCEKAREIMGSLSKRILRVAVVVSPTMELVQKIESLRFDILQVHGELCREVRERAGLPIWRAFNIASEAALEEWMRGERESGMANIEGYVADGSGYGGGKPFEWQEFREKIHAFTAGKKLILAGGLTEANVREGIDCFSPDVVDVSSGVEENGRKSEEKIRAFIRKVREDERENECSAS